MSEFRILSLDGGGSWALIQVRTLIEIYTRTMGRPAHEIRGHDVLRKFDFVAANSGGTLTLAGLLKNWTLAELLEFFRDETKRRAIFAPADIFDRLGDHVARLLGLGIGPKYSTKKKRAGLGQLLGAEGGVPLTAWPGRVGQNHAGRLPQFLFCALNYDTRRATFMRSDHESRAASLAPHPAITLIDAVHASANPPVNLFDLPAVAGAGADANRFWDGAIAGHNNPVMAAVIETLANAARYGTSRAEIKALSLGTGTNVLPLPKGPVAPSDAVLYADVDKPKLFTDVKKLALAIMGDPPDAATFHAHMLLEGRLPNPGDMTPFPSPVLRMNPLIQPVRPNGAWALPDGYTPARFKQLRDLDMDGITREEVVLIDEFCDRWIEGAIPNQPVRPNGETSTPDIGHATFAPALAEALRNFA